MADEKTLQLEFEHEGQMFVADFQHLRDNFHSEAQLFLKMFLLDEVSVYQLYGKNQDSNVVGTVLFLRIAVKL